MRKIFLFLLFISAFISCDREPQIVVEGGLLWKISGKGLDKPSYLFATWHGMNKFKGTAFLDSIDGFHDAFDSSERLLCEENILNFNATLFNEKSTLPDGLTYEKLLSKEDAVFLDSVVRKYIHKGIDDLRVNPKLLSNMLSGLRETEVSQLSIRDTTQIMDICIMKMAAEQGKSIVGLDSVIQFFYFESKDYKKDAKNLVKGLRETKKANTVSHAEKMEYVERLERAYRNQNLRETEICGYEMDKIKRDDVLLKNRNIKWMKHIPRLMEEKACFIAVGGMHLPMKDGLIDLLRKKGYTVEPI